MSETTTRIDATPETDGPPDPADILMALIIALLAPIFLGVCAGDVALARVAAIETVNAYRPRDQADLIAVAQIAAFGLAALGSLSLSLADDISVSMALRLRGNANALNRSAEQNRRARTSRANDPHPIGTAAEPETPATFPADDDPFEPGMLLSPAAEQALAAEARARLQSPGQNVPQVQAPPPSSTQSPTPTTQERRHQEMWAIAMVKEAGEINASIPNLPPAERKAASIRAAALSSTAHDLLYGAPVPPPRPGALARITRPDPAGDQRRQ